MKNIFNRANILVFAITSLSILTIVLLFSTGSINLENSIEKILPADEQLKRSVALAAGSSYANKLILFIENSDSEELDNSINEMEALVSGSALNLKPTIPGGETIEEIMSYIEENSLLLYPYEKGTNPFSSAALKKGLAGKFEYMQSIPFFFPSQSFFSDPLMMSSEIYRELAVGGFDQLKAYKGGLLSEDGKAFIMLYDVPFSREDYESTGELKELDLKAAELAENRGGTAFLYSVHLYFLESYDKIQGEVFIIFILSILFTLAIFFFFFKNINLVFFSFMPIIGGVATTFLLIALFFRSFNGIALGFGATTAGIAIDYTIHYITKINLYSSLKELRSKIGLSMLLGYLTTIISFILLPFSKIGTLQEIAFFGISAISCSFLLSWFVLQRVLTPERCTIKIKEINFRFPGKGLIGLFLIILLLTVGASLFVRLENSMSGLDMAHDELDGRIEQIKSHFNQSTDSIFLAFSGRNRDEIIEKSGRALRKLATIDPNLALRNPALFIPSKETINSRKALIKDRFNKDSFINALADSPFNEESFSGWAERVEQIDSLELTTLPDYLHSEIENSFVSWEGAEYLLIHVSERERLAAIGQTLEKEGIEFITVDILKDSESGLLLFEGRALILLLISIAAIFLVLLTVFRNLLHAFCSILPALCGLAAITAATTLLGLKFNIMHITASILILGIGVDYGIFVTGACRKGLDKREIGKTYQSILISALTTLAGFGILALSSNRALFSLGSSMLAGLIFAFLATYTLLPSLLGLKDKE